MCERQISNHANFVKELEHNSIQTYLFNHLLYQLSICQIYLSNMLVTFSFILKKMSCDLSEISTNNVKSNDIETIDEIFVFEFDKWIVVVAEKKIFDYTNTFDEISKNSFAFDIVSNNSFDWNRCCIVDDMKILNQEIFALIVIFDAFSKNSFALFFENLKISIAMNMSFLKHFMNMNDFVIESFDFDIAMNAISKNSSIQQIENSETTKKISVSIFIDFISDSICIYELFAFFVFDHNIDIDFQIYTIDIETFSFDWSRCCINFIDSNIFSISICIFVSIVIVIISNVIFISDVISEITTIDFYEKKQFLSFCFVNISVSTYVDVIFTDENTNFYERKQSFCFRVYIISIAVYIVVVVENIDAFILIVDLINITKNFVWMSFLSSVVNLISKSKHKKLSKMKIKRC